jgi:hypothetical protein
MPQLNNSVDEREILTWLESVSGDELNGKVLKEALKDGTILCKYVSQLELTRNTQLILEPSITCSRSTG